MVEVNGISKRFGENLSLDNITFKVEKGEILGLLGPNGAGKSTTMNIMTGCLAPTSGTILIDGKDILKNPIEAKKKIGYLPENPPLYNNMTVMEYLIFVYNLKGVKLPKTEHITEKMNLVNIFDVKDRIIKNLSKGYRQRVGLAAALIGDPELVVLDEPTVGLDPKQIHEIRKVIKMLGKKSTVVLSSHILTEVSAVCDRVVILENGKVLAIDSPNNLAVNTTENSILACIEGPEEEVALLLHSITEITSFTVSPSKEEGAFNYVIQVTQGCDIRKKLFLLLSEKKFPLLKIEESSQSLEEAFLKMLTEKEDV